MTKEEAQDFFGTKARIGDFSTAVRALKQKQWDLLKRTRTHLDPRQYELLKFRLKDEMTLEEVARHYGVTRERIRQIESAALGVIWELMYEPKQPHS